MKWKVEIKNKPHIFDAVGEGVKRDIEDLGIQTVDEVKTEQVYIIKGDLAKAQIERISRELLVDPVTQEYSFKKITTKPEVTSSILQPTPGLHVIEVAYNPGVMDPVEESTKKGIQDLGIYGVTSVKTAMRYLIKGRLSPTQVDLICDKLLANKVVQHIVKDERPYLPIPDYKFKLVEVNLLDADEAKLARISEEGQLFLNVVEMKTIRDHFRKLGRKPTDVELETLAQTWSEHCVHKTFKGKIEYTEVTSNQLSVTRNIDNLLKSTIMKVTRELNKPWCVSVFKDNSGIISFDEDYNVCFKVETHNHPSALEPYGGAGTGIGGVIRDPLGTGLGAKPIINTDVFCFGPPDLPFDKLPKGVLHPKRIMKGVVSGVRDYGNRMGIPTSNGAILFDERYTGNPLVYCGNVGIIPKDKCFKRVRPGDLIVLVGGKTGRDGIHGVTFASGELTQVSEVVSSGAVQIGNPITEKKLTDVLLQARDKGLYKAITDCGGGGLSSAVGELGEPTGVRVDLEKVPLKYRGLTYTEIWISEAQERMILSVPQKLVDELIELFAKENIEATVIGEFTNDRRLHLLYDGKTVCDLSMKFLHHGLPKVVRYAEWKQPIYKEPDFAEPKDLTDPLLKILSSWNVCSKEWVIRQYDHEVQGGSVLKPLIGVNNDGPGDGCITKPRLDSNKGIIISCGINPRYSLIDPYWMAGSCIDEALRQIIACGGDLDEVAILDNFSWGNTNKPDRLGGLVRAAQGCYDIAKAYGTPFISGKDSLNNEYMVDGESISIPGTLLISAMAVLKDVRRAVSADAKASGDLVYIVGKTYDELGGSHYLDIHGLVGNDVPKVRPNEGKASMDALSRAAKYGLVRACHDCSEGGIGVACAEMAFAGDLGMEIDLSKVPREEALDRNDAILFSESNSRFIVEVAEEDRKNFEKVMKAASFGLVGKITETKDFKVLGLDGKEIVSSSIAELKEAWQRPLRW